MGALALWAGLMVGSLGSSVALAEPPVALAPELLKGEGGPAAEAFGRGDPAEAARRYEVLLSTRGPSADLLYNLGTAWAQAGEPGRAIWALERARLLAPRDAAIGHNLEVTRQRVRVARLKQKTHGKLTEGDPDGLFWRRQLTRWTQRELAAPLVIFNVIFFALLALIRRMGRGSRRDVVVVLAGVAGLALLALGGALAGRTAALARIEVGVVLDARVSMSETPTSASASRQHADLYRGAQVRVLERRADGWVRIRLVEETVGWVRGKHIGLIP